MTSEPGALDAVGLRRVVTVLATVQITSWGVLYYAFAALQASITDDTGWSGVAVTGAFSLAQLVSGAVGLWVGHHLDRHGPRRVMTAASVVAVPGVLAVALAPTLAWFYAGWVLVGVAMAGALYPPAFAALTRWGGSRRVRALTTLTLVAGLASTVFAPLAAVLDGALGWRGAYLVLLVLLAAVTVPLHWWGLDHPWEPAASVPAGHPGAVPVARTRPFVLLATAGALAALSAFAVLVNLVPMLREQGLGPTTAALALGLGGVGQVLGRLLYARLAARTSLAARGVGVLAALAVATAALALAPRVAWVLVALATVLGLARGLQTLVQATAVTDRWGAASYGRLNGVLTAPTLAASAAAPFAGAALAEALGSYARAFLVLAALAGVAAVLMSLSVPRVLTPPTPDRTTEPGRLTP